MSSQSRNDGRRDERPTLPPIRHLLQDLRRPHDSSSLTLARLRVSDEPDDNSLAYMSRPDSLSSGDPNLGTPPEHRQRPSSEQHHQYYGQAVSSLQSNIGGRWSPPSLPGHASRLNERQGGNEHRRSPPRAGWSSQTSLRRNNLDFSDYPYEHGPFQYRHDDSTNRPSFDISYQGQSRIGLHAHQPGEIVTSVTPGLSFDDEQTPVARYGSAGPSSLPPTTPKAAEDKPSGSYVSKYECSYCGKGFNRPSSLKIHLNSHTGEKPFVCSVEGCGRSFSVLSNMRRHARVHSHIPAKQPDPSSDEESEQSVTSHDPSTVSAIGSDRSHSQYESSRRWHQRRDSTASTSSGTSSRRSHSYSSEERTDTSARPEKRLRGRPE